MYVVKIDAEGNQLWDQTFGSTAIDGAFGACATLDGGCVLVGCTERSGNRDVWIVKLNAAGTEQWERCYGGTNADGGIAIVQRPDGSYVAAGHSCSEPSGNKTSPFFGGGYWFDSSTGDFWVLWLDINGVKTSEQSFGGIYDEEVTGMGLAPDMGVVVVGMSLSPISGNKTSPQHGPCDGWVVRLNSSGNKVWEQSFGDAGWNTLYAVTVLNDGGAVIAAEVNGVACVARFTAGGTMIWQQTNGLAAMLEVDSVDQATNGAFFIAGTAWNGPAGFGGSDFVLVKTSPEPPVLSTSSTPDDLKTRGFLLDVFSRSGTNTCEWSANALEWLPLSTNVSSGYPYRVTDWGATNSPQRFYRVREE